MTKQEEIKRIQNLSFQEEENQIYVVHYTEHGIGDYFYILHSFKLLENAKKDLIEFINSFHEDNFSKYSFDISTSKLI